MTMMELLVVMGLIALIVGISVGAYGKLTRTYDLPAAASGVRALLLRARNTARQEGQRTEVLIDPSEREARALTRSWIGIWHFEMEDWQQPSQPSKFDFDIDGAYGNFGEVRGADLDWGKVGQALFFGPGGYLDAYDRATFNPRDGIILEAWINLDVNAFAISTGSGVDEPVEQADEFMVICKGSSPPDDFSYFLRVTSDFAVEAGVKGPPDSNAADGVYIVSTDDRAFEPRRWTKVGMTYDGDRLEIHVNGVPRYCEAPMVGGERLECPPRLEPSWGSLYISHPIRSFVGGIDEVRLGAIHYPENARYRLPGEVSFLLREDPAGEGGPFRIRFTAEGRLDPFLHPRPVRIVLTDAEGYRPSDEVIRRGLEAEAKASGKRRTLGPEEQRTRTPGEIPEVPDDHKAVITVELSGHIR